MYSKKIYNLFIDITISIFILYFYHDQQIQSKLFQIFNFSFQFFRRRTATLQHILINERYKLENS